MLLTIDIGNTSIAFGVYKNRELVAHFRIGTLKDRGVDEYAVFLRSLIPSKGISLSEIKDGSYPALSLPFLKPLRRSAGNASE